MITAPFRKSALPSEQADFHHAGRSTEEQLSQSVSRSLHAPLAYNPQCPDAGQTRKREGGREAKPKERERRVPTKTFRKAAPSLLP